MMRLFIEDGQLSLAIKKEIVQKIKEKACYISLNFEDELNLFKPNVYELPDGNEVVVKIIQELDASKHRLIHLLLVKMKLVYNKFFINRLQNIILI